MTVINHAHGRNRKTVTVPRDQQLVYYPNALHESSTTLYSPINFCTYAPRLVWCTLGQYTLSFQQIVFLGTN